MADASPLSPNGPQYVIEAGDYRAVVNGVGAALRGLTHQGRPLVVGYPEEQPPPGGAGQLLLPWPNRVAGGRYQFDGEQRQLDITEPATGNASHGFTRWLPWQLEAQSPGAVRLGITLYPMHGYPHVLQLSAEYALSAADGLAVTVTARNAGGTAAPYGLGAHPYLTLGQGPGALDDAVLEAPAETWLPVDEHKIPNGREQVAGGDYDFRKPRRIGDTVLDTAFTGLARDADGRARVRLTPGATAEPAVPADPAVGIGGPTGVELWVGPEIDWLQLYTGDTLGPAYRRSGIAVEPMSCPPNAFATGEDLLRLEPGEQTAHHWGIRAL